jgi:hypothetical protein
MTTGQEEIDLIRKNIFLSSPKYFLKNPTHDTFDLLKMTIHWETESERWDKLQDSIELSDAVRAADLGSLASNNERLEEIVVTCEEDLLKFMNSDLVKDLPCRFGTTIIQKHFLSNDKPIATTHLVT